MQTNYSVVDFIGVLHQLQVLIEKIQFNRRQLAMHLVLDTAIEEQYLPVLDNDTLVAYRSASNNLAHHLHIVVVTRNPVKRNFQFADFFGKSFIGYLGSILSYISRGQDQIDFLFFFLLDLNNPVRAIFSIHLQQCSLCNAIQMRICKLNDVDWILFSHCFHDFYADYCHLLHSKSGFIKLLPTFRQCVSHSPRNLFTCIFSSA